jgi:hypothetical protein
MHRRLSGIILAVAVAGLVGGSVAACGAAAPSPSPSPSPTPAGATSFAEYATGFCSAWGTLFRVVGNPDTAGWTDGVHKLQAAAVARDDATAAGLQGSINTELEAARAQVAYAAAWPPAARPMAELDRILVAFEKWTAAYVDIAKGVPNAPDPQAVFEAAGGVDAWRAMFATYADVASFRPATVAQCPDAPVTP